MQKVYAVVCYQDHECDMCSVEPFVVSVHTNKEAATVADHEHSEMTDEQVQEKYSWRHDHLHSPYVTVQESTLT